MEELSELKRCIQERGGLVATAKELGVSKGVLWAWINRKQVPVEKCSHVAAVLGIPRRSLRPHDWEQYWPERLEDDILQEKVA